MNIPKEWTFKTAEVATGFDNHVRMQLPWYELTTGVVAHIARHYIPEGGLVYDIGASTGNIGLAIKDTLESRKARLVAIDNSQDMVNLYAGPGDIVTANAEEFDFQEYDFAVLFLCLMFISPSKRADLMKKLRAKVRPGGAIVVFDKCVPATGYVATILSRLTIAGKVSAGVDAKEIVSKELSLSGIQRPIAVSEIEPAIEVFRFGDFAGWIIEG